VEAALAHGLIALLQYSPRSAADALGSGCGRLLDVLVPRLRQTAYRNLEFAYPGQDAAWRRRTVDGVYRSIGRLLVALARFPSIDRSNVGQWIGYEGFEHYEQAKAAGRGVLFATAHLGNWELSAFAHALLTERMNIVVRPLDNPLLDDLVETRRALSGNTLLSKRDFARSILHALRDNEPVGILVDQNSAGESTATDPDTRGSRAPPRPEFAPCLQPHRPTSEPADKTSARTAARCHSTPRTPESPPPRCAPPASQT
jgi:KDO2-lipid IV(A) lauroyltransferase